MDELNQNETFDKIQMIDIEDEMRQCYIDYAMSVIVARALPDVRDGLKPVHRRILHAMNELHLDPGKPYRKSARIVGDTMGKYHPHGDASIYDAMVRLAQDFSMRYMLVDGHGNFGSVDGDDPAASRYTEARFSKIAKEMMADIEKDTVDFTPNFDETEKEPTVLPSRFPNLLVNGASGIAVGMATNIPPHNLTEVIDASIHVIDNQLEGRETQTDELLKIVKGPDFPTGGLILGNSGLRDAYETGRGKIKVRAKIEIEPMPHDRERLVVRELPYQVNKAKLTEKIGELVRDKKIEGISDLRDESDRNGMRLVIELKKDANSNVILNQLYKFTQLQDTFGVISIALVDQQPKTLTLFEMLKYYLEHQKEVVTRRTKFELAKAQARAHILEGLLIALDNLDEVLDIMKTSKSIPHSKERLTERFALSPEQTQAIVQMTLGRLTGLEREKIENEYKEVKLLIDGLLAILNDEGKLFGVIKDELTAIRDKYGDARRTAIVPDVDDFDIEDLIEEQQDVITMTHLGYIKRIPLNTYRSQNRGGKGIIGMQTRSDDFVRRLFISSSHSYVLFFTNMGRVYRTKGYEIPEASRTARGMAIVNLLNLAPDEKVTTMIPLPREEQNEEQGEGYLFMTTQKGIVKKTALSEYRNVRKGGLIAINLKEDDKLISVALTDGKQNIFIATRKGMGIMFSEEDVRPMGRAAAGVKAIKLNPKDYVVSAEVVTDQEAKVLAVTQNGFGKCTKIKEFNVQNRNGKGLKIYKITSKSGEVAGVELVSDEDELILIQSEGIIIRLRVSEISTMGRITQGVKLMNLHGDVLVVGMAKIVESDDEEE